jgi:hypothetical protein
MSKLYIGSSMVSAVCRILGKEGCRGRGQDGRGEKSFAVHLECATVWQLDQTSAMVPRRKE